MITLSLPSRKFSEGRGRGEDVPRNTEVPFNSSRKTQKTPVFSPVCRSRLIFKSCRQISLALASFDILQMTEISPSRRKVAIMKKKYTFGMDEVERFASATRKIENIIYGSTRFK